MSGQPDETFEISAAETLIGRAPSCDLQISDESMSREHAVVLRRNEGVHLRDLGSLNGTYVNRRRIESEERLEDGDEVQVGKFRLAFIAG